MTQLSDLFPAGAGKQVSFVASGTLSNGQAVGLTSDGKVKAMSSQVGTESNFTSNRAYNTSTTYDSSNNRIVIAFGDQDNSFHGYAVVGTVSGSSISFGTAVVFNAGLVDGLSITFDSSNNKVVIAYRDGGASNHGKAIVGTVSGTSISFGSEVTFEAGTTQAIATTFDTNLNKVVIAYQDSGTIGRSIVGTVSGTSISFGTKVSFSITNSNNITITFDSDSNKVVIGYRNNGNSGKGTGIVGTVSGTSISFGTAAVYSASSASYQAITFDSSSNKVVAAYLDEGNSSYGTAVVGTVSGTSISFGTPVVFEAATTQDKAATFDSNLNKVIIAYQDAGNSSYGTIIAGTVLGTSISFETPTVFNPSSLSYISIAFDTTSNKAVTACRDAGAVPQYSGTSVTFDASGFPNSNFIGITDEAISDTASGNVTIKGGISTNVSSLTPATDYYVQDDGTISTVSSSVKAGKALSATAINLEYTS